MFHRFILIVFCFVIIQRNVFCMQMQRSIYVKKINNERYYPFPCLINNLSPIVDADFFAPQNTTLYLPENINDVYDPELKNKFALQMIKRDYGYIGDFPIHFYFNPCPFIPVGFFENLFLLWGKYNVYSERRVCLIDDKQFIANINDNKKEYRKIIVFFAPYSLLFLDNNSLHYVSPLLQSSIIAVAVPPDIREIIEKKERIPYENIIIYPVLATLKQTIIHWNACKSDLTDKGFCVYISENMTNFLYKDAEKMVDFDRLLVGKANDWWAAGVVYNNVMNILNH